MEIAHRLAAKEPVEQIDDVRGTAFFRRASPEGWFEIDSTSVDTPGRVESHVNPYMTTSEQAAAQGSTCSKDDGSATDSVAVAADSTSATDQNSPNPAIQPIRFVANPALKVKLKVPPREKTVIRLPSYEQVKSDPVLYAHANRVLHLETNPGNARALVQAHGEGVTARDVWINPPPIPLTTAEMDHVFDLPYARSPHPSYADEQGSHDGATKIPAWEMIRFSVNIMRGCFGGCTFCSITEHEGRIIQSRSEESIIKEVEDIRDKVAGFTGVISDLGGPTANMYRLGCRSPEIEAACRKPSCVYPGICPNLHTDHAPLVRLYRRARRIADAKFPRLKRLSEFNVDAVKTIQPAQLATLAAGHYMSAGEPVVLLGDSGTGKTHLLIGLGLAACEQGRRVRYITCAQLVNELVEAADERVLSRVVARYGRLDLLLLDEVTSALDPQLVGEVLDVIRDLKGDGLTIIMATHEMDFAREVADRIVFLADGRVVESGSPSAIFGAPQDPRTVAFLARHRG